MRRFWLKNAIGDSIDLMTRKLFVYKPKGLGPSYESSYERMSEGFFSAKTRRLAQGSIAGELVFTGADPYEQYQELIAWIYASEDIKVGYRPRENGEIYYARIDIERIDKGERNVTGELQCPFAFRLLSLWATETPITTAISATTLRLVYPRRYPFVYGNEGSAGETEPFILSGHVPGAVRVVIPGPIAYPIVSLYTKDNDGWMKIGEMVYDGSIPSGSTLTFTTEPDKAGVYRDSTLYLQALDVTKDNFFRIPTGGTRKITLSSDDDTTLSAVVTVYDYYVSI
ncbi:MAG: hypothetical protein Q4C04_04455 [Clostridia bacterium]|nr:hypothetical protein [Clostridia bacterium]